MKNIYKTKLIPHFLKQFLSDLLIFWGQNLPHPRLRIWVWRLRGAHLNKVRYIGMNCLIGNHPWLLTIHNDVVIASGTRILTEDASYKNLGGVSYSAPVVIEENVHVGMNCVIAPGVTIGKNSIVGAGSVVMRSVPAGSIVAGNPAKVVMSVEMGIQFQKIKGRDQRE